MDAYRRQADRPVDEGARKRWSVAPRAKGYIQNLVIVNGTMACGNMFMGNKLGAIACVTMSGVMIAVILAFTLRRRAS